MIVKNIIMNKTCTRVPDAIQTQREVTVSTWEHQRMSCSPALINEEKDDDSERALRSASACLARQPFFVPVATAGISIAARERMLRLV